MRTPSLRMFRPPGRKKHSHSKSWGADPVVPCPRLWVMWPTAVPQVPCLSAGAGAPGRDHGISPHLITGGRAGRAPAGAGDPSE